MSKIILIILLVLIVPAIPMPFAAAIIVWRMMLVRTSPEKWSRRSSFPDDPEYQRLFDIAKVWGDAHADKKQDVTVTSDGFRLVGEYYDLGHKKAVIIIPGRTEGCNYSYFFAKPYEEEGYNILVIDNRSHGLSEGKYNSLGFEEYKDIIEWSKLLHDNFGNDEVILHAICIGSETGLFALTSDECPEYLKAMVAEGMFATFYESFKNHMIEQKRPIFLGLHLIMLLEKIYAHADAVHDGPIYRIDKMRKPILFLHSKEDIYSLPERAVELYDKCQSPNKQIHWFPTGEHSRIRLVHEQEYDDAVKEFIHNI